MIPLDFSQELDNGMEVVLVNSKPYLFTNMRIDRSSIPEGWFAYDVRESEGGAGDFAEVQRFVLVNHWGTIIGMDELPLTERPPRGIVRPIQEDDDDCTHAHCVFLPSPHYICCEDDGNFIAFARTIKEFEEVRDELMV